MLETKKQKNSMTKLTLNIPILAVLTLGALRAEETPKGWLHAGNRPKDYEMSTDPKNARSGKTSAYLKCIVAEPSGFGTLMQAFKADAYRGKRLRMSGYARTQEVADWSGFWMRVDGPNREPLAFDNMEKRPIKGTSDWRHYEVVLEISPEANEIAFGMLLSGKGRVWMDDLKFEVVGKDVPTTGENISPPPPSGPLNLDFEE